MLVVLQLVGAVLILAAFLAGQFRGWSPSSVRYLVLNLLGAGLLAGVALLGQDWGFLLLEGVWAVTSAVSLARVLGVLGLRASADSPPAAH